MLLASSVYALCTYVHAVQFIEVFYLPVVSVTAVFVAGELFAPEVKGAASGLAASFSWSLAFLVTLSFTPLVNGITEAGVFWLFAAICFGGVGYIAVFCYETNGKTLQEIQDYFRTRSL